jgi:hypothetical protein
MAYISTEIEVDASEFEDDELIKELTSRGYTIDSIGTDSALYGDIYEIFEAYQLKSNNIEHLVHELIYKAIGRIV